MKTKLLIFLTMTLTLDAYAGSATWLLNAGDGNWNDASHWIPATVPNGPDDIATFDVSNTLVPSIFADTEVNSIVFDSNASAFTVTATPGFALTISGEGITNNSGSEENFLNAVQDFVINGQAGSTIFTGAATAGAQNTFTNDAQIYDYSGDAGRIDFYDTSTGGSATFINLGSGTYNGTEIEFHDNSTAGDATITNNALSGVLGANAQILFVDASTAGNTTITNKAAGNPYSPGGWVQFFNDATAGNAIISNEGSSTETESAAETFFFGASSADNATLIANGGVEFGGALIAFGDGTTAGNATIIINGELDDVEPGMLFFNSSSTGGTARIELFGKGTLLLANRAVRQVTVGSIEGDGFVTLEDNQLIVGSNNLSTTFSGIISDGDLGGSFAKIGNGTLVLLNANTYAGGTRVNRGALKVNNTGGSGTGSGPVQVDGGSFGGTGIVSGAVMVGNRRPAKLAPGNHGRGSLTILNTLTFGQGGKYSWSFDSRTFQAESVTAQGATIESGALFSPLSIGNVQLPLGTVFVVINNIAATPIAGSFVNLPDGGTITIGSNTFQANYEGGDGNDLTLTVIP